MTERNPWNEEGYASPPETRKAMGHEIIFRAYNSGGQRLSNCFFMPSISGISIGYWTAELLETELNAALWGNNFERIAKFQICKDVEYKVGSIAHDKYSGIDNGQNFQQRSFITPSGIFKQ